MLRGAAGFSAPALFSPPCWHRTQTVWEHSCPHVCAVGVCLVHWCNGRTHPVLPQAANRGRRCLNTSRASALVTYWVLFISHQCTTLFWRFVLDERRRNSSPIAGFLWFCLVFPGFSPGSHPCSSLSPPWAHKERGEQCCSSTCGMPEGHCSSWLPVRKKSGNWIPLQETLIF